MGRRILRKTVEREFFSFLQIYKTKLIFRVARYWCKTKQYNSWHDLFAEIKKFDTQYSALTVLKLCKGQIAVHVGEVMIAFSDIIKR